MSEKQFDIFDDRFKKAADQYQPEFDEASWKKMEAKLNEGKDRRRPIGWFWWLTDGLMIGLMVFMAATVYTDHQQLKTIGKNEKTKPAFSNPDLKNNAISVAASNAKAQPETTFKKEEIINGSASNTASSGIESASGTNGNTNGPSVKNKMDRKRKPAFSKRETLINNTNNTIADNRNAGKPVENFLPGNGHATLAAIDNKTAGNENVLTGSTMPLADLKTSTTDSAAKEKKTVKAAAVPEKDSTIKKTGNKKNTIKSSRFYLQLQASPEWSYIPGNAVSPVTLNYGGGVGFTINKKWSVQAGINASKKNYMAGPNDYKAKPGTYFYNLKMHWVKAFCHVLEIPVTVNYSLLNRKRQSLVASAGFASLLMDKETYHYHYEHANGVPGYSVHTYQTGHFHLFADALLAVGYQFNLNKSFSVRAAPYVKIPLYGVGEGSVKIGSTGVMVGLQYQLPTVRK